MKRSYFGNVYFKKKPPDSLTKFKKQSNYYRKLLKKDRNKYFESLNPRMISDNNIFFGKAYNLFSLKNKRLAIR